MRDDINNKIAFVTDEYQDVDFSSGGVKLNFFFLQELIQRGCQVDLFVKKLVFNKKKIFANVYPIEKFEELKKDYSLVLSDKAVVPSDITYIHDHSYPYRIKMMSNPFAHFLYKIFCKKRYKRRMTEYLHVKRNIRKINKVVVSSNLLKQDMIENYGVKPEHIEIIPPPIEKYEINRDENEFFTFGISAIGFVRKGGYVLLKAIRDLKNYDKDFRVKIIYTSNNLCVKTLISLYGIEKYCCFQPIQKDMGAFYNSLDCLLVPSIVEPFGMVATEALSCGCPVIVSSNCGAKDFVKNGENGFVYDFSNKSHKGLTEAMKKMLEMDNTELDKIRQKAVKSVASTKIDFSKLVDAVLKMQGEKLCSP